MLNTPPLSTEPLRFVFPEVIDSVLADGTPLYVIPKADEDIVTFGIYLRSGSAHEDIPGSTAFATEMLTRGTKNHSSEDFDELVEGLGSTIRSACDRDVSVVNGSSLTEHFYKTAALAVECLLQPTFNEREFEVLKQQSITDASIDETDPDWLATQASNRVCYRGHPYERRRKGTIADMIALSRGQLNGAHERVLRSPRTLVVAGNVNALDITAMFNELLSSLPTVSFDPTLPNARLSEGKGCVAINAEAVQTAFRISLPGLHYSDPDYPAMRLIIGTLGGYTLARLFNVLREEKGYTYGAYAMNSIRPYATSTDIVTSVGNEFTADTMNTIAEELQKINTQPIPADELENTRQHILGSFARNNETPQQTAGLLWTTLLHGLPRDYYPRLIDRIQQLTPEDLVDVQLRYFDQSKWAIGASGIPDVIVPAIEKHVSEVELIQIATTKEPA